MLLPLAWSLVGERRSLSGLPKLLLWPRDSWGPARRVRLGTPLKAEEAFHRLAVRRDPEDFCRLQLVRSAPFALGRALDSSTSKNSDGGS